MRYFQRLWCVFFSLFSTATLFSCADEAPKKRFNIVLISIDSLRADHVHSYGYPIHGQEFFEHKDKGHAKTLFDEVLLVPLIMRLPGHIEAGKRIKDQVRHLDIMSTLLPFAGLPENLDGVDLAELVDGKAAPLPLEAMSRLYQQGLYVSMCTPQFKYITFRQRRTETESLYDLENEPQELRPVFWRKQRVRSRNAQESFDELKALLVREELETLRSAAKRGDRDEDAIELPEDLKERLKPWTIFSET
jgi:hypothetical protein